MRKEIAEKFGGKLRVRVNGILMRENQLLMVKHRGLGELGYFWSPPGGGVSFGQSLTGSLEREFLEETGLHVNVEKFLFVYEFHHSPLHAVELFFEVTQTGGTLGVGYDPELEEGSQIIEDVKYWGIDDFRAENGPQLHSVFQNIQQVEELLKLRGYFQNWK